MKKSLRILSVVFALLLILPIFHYSPLLAEGEDAITGEETAEIPSADMARAFYLYCFDADAVLFSKNESNTYPPSSTAKMMTALLVSEAYKDFSESITLTEELLIGTGGGSTGYSRGMTVTVQDLFDSLVCQGATDASIILANAVSGSVNDFVREMNRRAKSLGMEATVYANPTGLDPSDGQTAYTTAHDVSLLASVLYSDGRFMEASDSPSCYIESLSKRVYNRNNFITTWHTNKYYDASVSGMNAGNTTTAGYNVTSVKVIGGVTYLCVVLGATADGDVNYSYEIAKELFAIADGSYGYVEALSAAKVLCELSVKYGNESDYVAVIPSRASFVYLPISDGIEERISVSWGTFEDYLSAPFKAGTVVGEATVYYDGVPVDTVELITAASVARSKTSYFLNIIRGALSSYVVWEIIAAALIILIIFIVRRLYRKYGSDIFVVSNYFPLLKKKSPSDYDDIGEDDIGEDDSSDEENAD